MEVSGFGLKSLPYLRSRYPGNVLILGADPVGVGFGRLTSRVSESDP